jgi:hypothetical protein
MLLNSLLHGIIFQWISHEILSQINNGLATVLPFQIAFFISLSKMRIVHGLEAHMTWGVWNILLKTIMFWWVLCFETWNLSWCFDGCYVLKLETYHVSIGVMFWNLKLIMFWLVLSFESWNLSCFDWCYVLKLETYHALMGVMFWILKLIMFWWVLCFETWNLSCFDGCYVLKLETYHALMGVMFWILKLIMLWWVLCFRVSFAHTLSCLWTSLPKSPGSDNLQNL